MKKQYSGIYKSAIYKEPKLFSVLVIYTYMYVNLIRNFSELPLFILQQVGNRYCVIASIHL